MNYAQFEIDFAIETASSMAFKTLGKAAKACLTHQAVEQCS